MLYNRHLCPSPELFHLPKLNIFYSLNTNFPFSTPLWQSLVITILFFVSLECLNCAFLPKSAFFFFFRPALIPDVEFLRYLCYASFLVNVYFIQRERTLN